MATRTVKVLVPAGQIVRSQTLRSCPKLPLCVDGVYCVYSRRDEAPFEAVVPP